MITVDGIEAELDKLRTKPTIANLLNRLNSCGPALVFGGAIRDWVVGKTPRDIDIVLDCPRQALNFLTEFKAEKNRFGGYYLLLDGVELDIWNLDASWPHKNDSKFERKLESLTKTPFFNMDAVTYRLDTKVIQDDGFTQAMETKTLDIVYEPNPFPFLCVSKALCALSKYDMQPSANLKRYIDEQVHRGYTQKSFDKYVELKNIPLKFEECIKKLV